MEQMYRRIQNFDDKVKEASLPYMHWKVLFLIGEHAEAGEISSLLGEDVSKINDIFASLESDGYIEAASPEKEEPVKDKTEAEKVEPGLGDELVFEDESGAGSKEDKSDDTAAAPEEEIEPAPEGESVTAEAMLELAEEKDVSTENDIVDINRDFLTEEMIPVDEAKRMEEQRSEMPAEQAVKKAGDEESDIEEDEFNIGLDLDDSKQEQEIPAGEEQKKEETVEKAEAAPQIAPEEETISDVSKKTIMVIDDSIVIRKMIEIALEDEDFNIITAISGKEGLEAIEARQPNLIILDMMLPDMNGIEVLKTIKGSKKVPVIMLSGKDSPQLIESAKEVGVDDFLPKPFRDEDLVEKVKSLVGD